jgi:hypothetical protein
MNKAQKIALGLGLAAFATSLLFMPAWDEAADKVFIYRAPVWNVYQEHEGIHLSGLLIDWIIIGVLTGGAMLLLKKTKE